jgi:anti-anti-sigma factor
MVRPPFGWYPPHRPRSGFLTSSAHRLIATSPPIRVRLHTAGGRTDVAVAGEVDLASVDVLRSAIFGALASNVAELTIDLCETEFMDSSGLHVLVDAYREARRLDRRLAIVCPPGPVRRLFDLTGLAGVLPLSD